MNIEKEVTEFNLDLIEINLDLRKIENDKHQTDLDLIEDIKNKEYKPYA